nr:TetR/AcrR family transcriptional regulator [Parapontixanthobacter aurantiacus]
MIVDAASRSFFEHGYAASSIEQISADAGVSKVTVYKHFGDKSALLSAAVERECDRMRGHFELEPTGCGTIAERLFTIGEAMVAFLARPKMIQFERRIAAETERDPEIGQAFLNSGPRTMMAALARLLEAIDASGDLSIADPMLAAEQFAAMCKGFGDLERRFGVTTDGATDRRRIEAAVDVFLKAYAPANRRS